MPYYLLLKEFDTKFFSLAQDDSASFFRKLNRTRQNAREFKPPRARGDLLCFRGGG
jgi:hypothetical protein